MQTGAALGMQTLDASLQDLVVRGLVTVEEARRHAEDPRAIGGAGFAPPPPTVP
jgi:Tfp pilus assembly pilus retraction ATPase PilT